MPVPDDDDRRIHRPLPRHQNGPLMPSFRLRVSISLAAILAAAVLAEAGAGSPTVPACTAPAGGWKASNGAQVTPAREARLVVLVDRYRRPNGLGLAQPGHPRPAPGLGSPCPGQP